MPRKLDPALISTAQAAVDHAQRVRRVHARRTARTSETRAADIQLALVRLKEAMAPIRSELGKHHHSLPSVESEANYFKLRDASLAIQKERRKLWKLQQYRKPKS